MRLLASDVDGTLLPRRGEMSGRTVAALRAAERAGVHVVLATGRPPRWMPDIVAASGVRGHAVLANGALVVDLARIEEPGHGIVRSRTIDPDVVLELATTLRRTIPGIHFAIEAVNGFGVEHDWPHAIEADLPRAALTDLLAASGGVFKLLLKGEAPQTDPATTTPGQGAGDELLEATMALLHGRGEATHSGSHIPLVEIGPAGTSKASTLAELADELEVDAADAIAFGDMPNDVAMLRWAGTGYAMADGHPDAHAAADEIAPACAEDGVAQVVERRLAELLGRATA